MEKVLYTNKFFPNGIELNKIGEKVYHALGETKHVTFLQFPDDKSIVIVEKFVSLLDDSESTCDTHLPFDYLKIIAPHI